MPSKYVFSICFLARAAAFFGVFVVIAGLTSPLVAEKGKVPKECRALAAPPVEGGVGAADIDAPLAIAACKDAVASEPGNGALRAFLARALAKTEDWPAMRTAIEEGIKTGAPQALWYGGVILEFGFGTQPDPEGAAELYRQAAEDHAYALAQHNLAVLYENGRGVPLDQQEAQRLFEAAAAQDYPSSVQALGERYDTGRGVSPDAERAFGHFRYGADLGYAPSQLSLGRAYESGRGTGFDINEALRWMTAAAEQEYLPAQTELIETWDNILRVTGNNDHQLELARWVRTVLNGDHGSVDAYRFALSKVEFNHNLISNGEEIAGLEKLIMAESGSNEGPAYLEARTDLSFKLFLAVNQRLRLVDTHDIRSPTEAEVSRTRAIYRALNQDGLSAIDKISLYEELATLQAATSGPEHPDTAKAYGYLAASFAAAGFPQKASEAYAKKAAILRDDYERPRILAEEVAREAHAIGNDVAEYGALNVLDHIFEEIGDVDPREAVLHQKYRIRPQDMPPIIRQLTSAELDRMGDIVSKLWRMSDGDPEELDLKREMLEINLATYGPGHAQTADSYGSLGRTLSYLGYLDEAVEAYQTQADQLVALLGSEHKMSVDAIQKLASAQLSTGDTEQSIAILSDLLAKIDATEGPLAYNSIYYLDRLEAALELVGPVERHAEVARDRFERHMQIAPTASFRTANWLWQAHGAIRATGLVEEADAFLEDAHRKIVLHAQSPAAMTPEELKDMRQYASFFILPGYGLYAEEVGRIALRNARALFGDQSVETGESLAALAFILDRVGRSEEAVPMADAAVRILRSASANDATLIDALQTQLSISLVKNRKSERILVAEEIYAIVSGAENGDEDDIVSARLTLAETLLFDEQHEASAAIVTDLYESFSNRTSYWQWSDIVEAQAIHALLAGNLDRSASMLKQEFPGWDEADGAVTLSNAFRLRLLLGIQRPEAAFAIAEKKLETLRSLSNDVAANATQSESARKALNNTREFLGYLLARAAFDVAKKHPDEPAIQQRYMEAAFYAAQPAAVSAAAGSASRAAARRAAVAAGVGDTVRRWEGAVWTLANLRETEAETMLEAFQKGEAFRNAWVNQLANRRASAEKVLDEVETELRQKAPAFLNFLSPQAMTLDEIRTSALLSEDEVLILLVPGFDDGPGLVWAISADDAAWAEISIEAEELNTRISGLRVDIDAVLRNFVSESPSSDAASDRFPAFRRTLAHELYLDLFGAPEIARVIADKAEWKLVPHSVFLSLPFAALVTAPPPGNDIDPEAYRQTAWLGTVKALSVLTTPAALRRTGTADDQRRALRNRFIGIGDPDFEGDAGSAAPIKVARMYSGRIGNAEGLRQLKRLPWTRAEVKQVASILGQENSDILLGSSASEQALADLAEAGQLAEAGLILFATHGLVSGDFDMLSEPALALTPPETPSILANGRDSVDDAALQFAAADGRWINDGLLTASEISRLSLNAEWVILSACNTAAAETPGADGLSGLASGFLQAGARALLVSHWPLEDRAAARMTTRLVELRETEQTMSRAEALRRVMKEVIGDAKDPLNAHPAIWASYHLVEG